MKLKNRIICSAILTFSLAISLSTGSIVKAENNKSNISTSSGSVIQKISDDVQIDWTKNIIKVTGMGAPPDRGNNAQKRLMAIRAAKADAFRQLLESIQGVHVSSETVVRDFVTESDVIKTKVEGLVKGAEQVGEPRYMSDGSVEVDMQIKLFGENKEIPVPKDKEPANTSAEPGNDSLASAIMTEEIKRRETDSVPNTKIKPETTNETYTALILDCKGLGVQPAMSPAIFDSDGGEVYVGALPIDPDYVINEGIVSYATGVSEAKKNERAGDNPLVIKAKKVSGLFKADMTITNDDAKKLIGAENKGQFLKDFKVIMVI